MTQEFAEENGLVLAVAEISRQHRRHVVRFARVFVDRDRHVADAVLYVPDHVGKERLRRGRGGMNLLNPLGEVRRERVVRFEHHLRRRFAYFFPRGKLAIVDPLHRQEAGRKGQVLGDWRDVVPAPRAFDQSPRRYRRRPVRSPCYEAARRVDGRDDKTIRHRTVLAEKPPRRTKRPESLPKSGGFVACRE